MIQNIYLYFFKRLRYANLRRWALNGCCLFKNVCKLHKASLPGTQFERLFSWICYEMWVDKYENMNIESIHSILLYELTHLICWLKAYSSKLLCATACVRLCVCVSRALKMHSAERSSLREHSCTSRLRKHTLHYIDKMLLCILYDFKTFTHCIHPKKTHVLLEWKCIKL